MKIAKLGQLWAVYWKDTGALFLCFSTWEDALEGALKAVEWQRRRRG